MEINSWFINEDLERRMKDWMYPFPTFFTTHPLYKYMVEEIENLDRRLEFDLKNDLNGNLREQLKKILERGAGEWTTIDESGSKFMWSSVLVRIAQYTSEELTVRWCFPELLEEYLHEARSIEDVTKMFHYFGPFQAVDALVLYLTSPFDDRHNMAQFLIRHSSFAIHFHENVHPLADVWTTELHLSFIQLVDTEREKYNEAARYVTVCDGYQRSFPHAVSGSQLDVFKASLSYRFVGDMTDRFWSGYLLSYLPQNSKLLKNPDWYVGAKDLKSWFYTNTERDQRKILEPFLVEKMAGEIYQSTRIVLDCVDDWLNPTIGYLSGKGASSKSTRTKSKERNFDVRYMRSTICIDIDSILTTIRRCSEANLYSLDQWVKREENRHYKPRWTESDELRYRDLVDIQRKRAENQISMLHDQHRHIQSSIDQVKSHRQELIDILSLAESRVAANNAENVRIFTYATVIFYPLSFLSSFFSMQGLPNHDTVVLFVRATAIALTVTLLVVFNAETIAYPIRRLRFSISQQAREKMEESSNVFPFTWRKTLDQINTDEKQEVTHDNEPPKPPRSNLIYLLFLLVYLLVEYPAQRIALAYESLRRVHLADTNQVFLTLGRLLFAMILMPIFVPVWIILAFWTLVPLALLDVRYFSGRIWTDIQNRIDKRLDQDRPIHTTHGLDEKQEQNEESGTGPRSPTSQQQEGKTSRMVNRFSTPQTPLKDKLVQDRQNREERLQNQVSLLINPAEMLDQVVWRRIRARKSPKDDDGIEV